MIIGVLANSQPELADAVSRFPTPQLPIIVKSFPELRIVGFVSLKLGHLFGIPLKSNSAQYGVACRDRHSMSGRDDLQWNLT